MFKKDSNALREKMSKILGSYYCKLKHCFAVGKKSLLPNSCDSKRKQKKHQLEFKMPSHLLAYELSLLLSV